MNVIEAKGVSKSFGPVHALRGVDFTLKKGEVKVLLGENGAGKTTLMRTFYGMIKPDKGQINFKDTPVEIKNSRIAMDLGIGMVHQHFMLVEDMTVYENIAVGFEKHNGIFYDKEKIIEELSELAKQFNFDIDPMIRIRELSIGQKQRVEILKTLYRKSTTIILDEPTAVLTPQEVDVLFGVIRQLKDSGVSIVIITHKLKECLEIADRITIMRDGEVVAKDIQPADTNIQELADLMVGRNVPLNITRRSEDIGGVVLKVSNLNLQGRAKAALEDINFEIRKGEILGVAGVEGNGQKELAEVLTGNQQPDGMELIFDRKPLQGAPVDFMTAGIGFIPEDRRSEGLVTDLNIIANIILGYHRTKKFLNRFFFKKSAIESYAQKCMDNFKIKAHNTRTIVATLSGGNQQKVVIARVISQNPKCIVCAQPTRGVDVGAINYIHNRIFDYRDEGNGVLLISADLDEVRSVSDRIMVLCNGKIVAIDKADNFTESQLGILMLGTGEA